MRRRNSTLQGNPTLADFIIPQVAVPESASDREKAAAEAANVSLSKLVKGLADLDPKLSMFRIGTVAVIAFVSVVGAIATIIGAVRESEAAAIAGTVAALGGLIVGAVMNPLQTVERDIVVRRWSDVIVSSWAASLAAGRSPATALRQASKEFEKLGAAYAALTSKTLETISLSFPGDAAEEEAAESETDRDPLKLELPDSQATAQGAVVDQFTSAVASGGVGPYTYDAEGLPPDLSITPNGGEFIGTVAAGADTRDWTVTVTATDAGDEDDPPSTVTGKFVWAIEVPAT